VLRLIRVHRGTGRPASNPGLLRRDLVIIG
jgi:hypothetical protein